MIHIRIPNSFPTFRQLLIIECILITLILSIVYYTRYISRTPYFFTFQTIPYLSKDKSQISFKFRKIPNSNLQFSIIGYGAKTTNQIAEYCINRQCTIPFVIGGHVSFKIHDDKTIIYEEVFDLPPLNFSCTSNHWENRTCHAKNICYNSGIFSLLSPFPISFDLNMLTLSSRSPPNDFSYSRLQNCFTHQFFLPQGIPYLRNKSNLISIFHHMEQEWHLYFDLLLPTFLTLSNTDQNYKNHRIIFHSYCNLVPHIITAFTNHKIHCLDRPLCFEELEMGMIKVTNYTKNEIEPPYDFPDNLSSQFFEAIYDFYNISNNRSENKNKNILIVNRLYNRKLLNIHKLVNTIKNYFPNDNVSLKYFEEYSIKSQILALKDTDIFISVHGSALANLLWMKPGSYIIEIFPYQFTCRDWYEKAAKFMKLNYISYHPHGIDETDLSNPSEALQKCYKGKWKCSSSNCLDILRDQNVDVNLDLFQKKLDEYFKR